MEEFPLQFFNTFGCESVVRLCLFAEWIGVCNFSWLLYGTVSKVACKKVRKYAKKMSTTSRDNLATSDNSDDPMSPHVANRGPNFDTGLVRKEPLNWFDYCKYVWSTFVTLGSLVIVIYGVSIESYVLPVPAPAAFVLAIVLLTILFYLEGTMIAISAVQYWDGNTFKSIYPRAYHVHTLLNQPENVKRFIIGRQFFTVLTNFLLAQIFVFVKFSDEGYQPILFWIVVKSGLVGVFIILAFAQLLPELLAAEYPLRFLNLYGAYTTCYLCLFFDSIAVGHCAWAYYYLFRSIICRNHMAEGGKGLASDKPGALTVQSAEILSKSHKQATSAV